MGHRMMTRTLNIVIALLVVGLLICSGILVRQHLQIAALQSQLAETEFHVYQVEKASEISQANRASITQRRSLSSGIYELKTDVAVDPFETELKPYTIYHIVLSIEVGAIRQRVQFGYASSGMFSHIFYFDHDGDGKIDTGMMEEYAESIPVVGMAAPWLIDPELSQSLYNAFRLDSDMAVKLTMNEIATRVDSKLEIVWEWITESSSDFGAWIENAVDFD